jgi:uncharacterized protein
MRIVIDIVHPADVHFFKYAIRDWEARGHNVLVTVRDKEITLQLLAAYGIASTYISSQGRGLWGLFKELLIRDVRLYRIARRFRPDVLIGFSGISVAHVGKLLGKPSIIFYDTEFAHLLNALTYPFASVVCTPTCYSGDIGPKHVRFPGYKELAYLHPRHFTPDPSIVEQLGIQPDSRFFIVRFVSWEASHDRQERGVSDANKIRIVDELARQGRVLVSSEGQLPDALAPYRAPVSVDKMHHVMAFATLYVGESATMATECAVLGVPAIFIATTGRGYITELQQQYGLVFHLSDTEQDHAFDKIRELLAEPNLKASWQQRREHMLSEKIDVSAWMVDFIENYAVNRHRRYTSLT